MAFTPCAFHGAKYTGGANTFFLRLVRGQESRGGKIQVCADCATLALDYLSQRAVKVSEGDRFLEYTDPVACGNDGSDVGAGYWTLYGNAYPRGMAESQWYMRVCNTCADAVAEDLHLDDVQARP